MACGTFLFTNVLLRDRSLITGCGLATMGGGVKIVWTPPGDGGQIFVTLFQHH